MHTHKSHRDKEEYRAAEATADTPPRPRRLSARAYSREMVQPCPRLCCNCGQPEPQEAARAE